jgi:hypothetical protein
MSNKQTSADCTRDDCDGTIHALGTSLKHGFKCDTCPNKFRKNL